MPDLSTLSDESLWCREEQHSFAFTTDVTTVSPKGRLIEWVRKMECRECGALAKREIDPKTFHASPRKIYAYPENYLLKGQGRVGKDDVMREQYHRLRVA